MFSPLDTEQDKNASFTPPVHTCTRSPSKYNMTRRGNKRKQTGKIERKKTVFLCRWHECLYEKLF